jgi:hypothetical protein
MGSFSNYWENEILDHLFGKGAYVPPTIYVALSAADPGETGAGLSEPVGSGYARVYTAGGDWNAANSGLLDNAGAIVFNAATGDWGTLTHFALFDALTGGNMLAHGTLTLAKTVGSGDTVQFAPGDLSVTLD